MWWILPSGEHEIQLNFIYVAYWYVFKNKSMRNYKDIPCTISPNDNFITLIVYRKGAVDKLIIICYHK